MFSFLSRNPPAEFACLFNRNAWDILGIDFGKKINTFPKSLFWWLAMEIWWDWTVIRGVMFLFRGEFGCLMYTGDFRWEVDSKRAKDARSRLLNVLKNETVDSLYLDNMYCNPSYDFPTQEVTTQQVGFAYFLFT